LAFMADTAMRKASILSCRKFIGHSHINNIESG
jgi:hypothetical protein